MQIFLTEEFILEVKKLQKNKSHGDCEEILIESIFTKDISEVKETGTKRLGGDPVKSPFLRKRVQSKGSGKSSGYRLYFWLLIEEENVYLLFIHPKTGRRSGTNLTTAKQKELVKTFRELRQKEEFIQVELDEDTSKIIFLEGGKQVF